MLKEAEHGAAGDNAVSAGGASGSDNVAVGQLIDFGADTPSPGPTAAMANLCMSLNAEECADYHSYLLL